MYYVNFLKEYNKGGKLCTRVIIIVITDIYFPENVSRFRNVDVNTTQINKHKAFSIHFQFKNTQLEDK